MDANDRYENAWNEFIEELNQNPKARLATFLREKRIYSHGIKRWMSERGLSVRHAKREICKYRHEEMGCQEECSEYTGAMFLPVGIDNIPQSETSLQGISFTFPDGTQVRIKQGSAEALISFLKLYRREDGSCLG